MCELVEPVVDLGFSAARRRRASHEERRRRSASQRAGLIEPVSIEICSSSSTSLTAAHSHLDVLHRRQFQPAQPAQLAPAVGVVCIACHRLASRWSHAGDGARRPQFPTPSPSRSTSPARAQALGLDLAGGAGEDVVITKVTPHAAARSGQLFEHLAMLAINNVACSAGAASALAMLKSLSGKSSVRTARPAANHRPRSRPSRRATCAPSGLPLPARSCTRRRTPRLGRRRRRGCAARFSRPRRRASAHRRQRLGRRGRRRCASSTRRSGLRQPIADLSRASTEALQPVAAAVAARWPAAADFPAELATSSSVSRATARRRRPPPCEAAV